MRIANAQLLWLAAIFLVALAWFLVWAWRRKQQLIRQFVQSRLLANLTVGVSQTRQKLRLMLLFAAVAFLLLGLARPQWGFDWEEARQQGLDILIAIDTSKSMLAEDIPPNRLARARLAAFDLMKLAQSDRLGLIAFAGSSFLQCPLTIDEEAFRQSVNALDTEIIPQGGSSLAEPIQTAIQAFDKSGDNHKVLVLFTDGEDHDSGAVAAAEKAADAGMRIFTIGVGTREGELLRIRDEQGNAGFIKDDQGNVVKSRLNETLLQEVATKANGFYLPLVGANPMESLYQKGLAPLPKTESATKLVKNYREQYKWPLGLAMLLLIVEMFLPQRNPARRPETLPGLTSCNLKASATVSLLLLACVAGMASPSKAQRQYESGRYQESFEEYHRLLQSRTNDFRLHYNAGNAAYRAEAFDLALKHFESALQSPDLALQQRAHYNLGNTFFQLGDPLPDPKEKKTLWEKAAKNYEHALKLNPEDTDSKHNLEFVKKRLEELKQEQQQQQQSKNDQSEKNDDQEKQDQSDQQQSQNQEQDPNQQRDNSKQPDQQNTPNEEQQPQPSGQQNPEQQQQPQEQPAQNSQAQEHQNGTQEESAEAEAAGIPAQMSLQQALQFLEAQKHEEKPLIFAPPSQPKPLSQKLKDW